MYFFKHEQTPGQCKEAMLLYVHITGKNVMTAETSDPSVRKKNNLKVVTVMLFAICNSSGCENY